MFASFQMFTRLDGHNLSDGLNIHLICKLVPLCLYIE